MKRKNYIGDCLENKSYGATVVLSLCGSYLAYILLCAFKIIEFGDLIGILQALPVCYLIGSYMCVMYLGGFSRNALFFCALSYFNFCKLGALLLTKWYLLIFTLPLFILMCNCGLLVLVVGFVISLVTAPFFYPFTIASQVKAHNDPRLKSTN